MKKIIYLFITFFIIQSHFSQEYFRIKSDFTVKIKNSNGKMSLTKGKLFYDKNYKHLIYNITFPSPEKWVMHDTLLIKIKPGKKPEINKIPSINEFSIFHLALNVGLSNFGLDNTIYKVIKVEKKNSLVISYWKLPKNMLESMDHIIIAKKNNQLQNVIIVDNNNKIISKQFFKDYININAFQFPRKVIHITYDQNGLPDYQVFEFKNIELNEMKNENDYFYNL